MPVPVRTRGGGARGLGEGALHGAGELAHQQHAHQAVVGEGRLVEGQPDAEQRVIAQAAGLGQAGAGGQQRVPGAAGLVGTEVLDRVEEVRDPASQCGFTVTSTQGSPDRPRIAGQAASGLATSARKSGSPVAWADTSIR